MCLCVITHPGRFLDIVNVFKRLLSNALYRSTFDTYWILYCTHIAEYQFKESYIYIYIPLGQRKVVNSKSSKLDTSYPSKILQVHCLKATVCTIRQTCDYHPTQEIRISMW
jgi:hypothetical protein